MPEITLERMSNEELVNAANDLAATFYSRLGYTTTEGFKFYESQHPTELAMWNMACDAFEHIRGSDVWDALSEVQDEGSE